MEREYHLENCLSGPNKAGLTTSRVFVDVKYVYCGGEMYSIISTKSRSQWDHDWLSAQMQQKALTTGLLPPNSHTPLALLHEKGPNACFVKISINILEKSEMSPTDCFLCTENQSICPGAVRL